MKPSTVLLARNAMATRFEIVLFDGDPVRLRAAGEEALDEIERIEAQLSIYRTASVITEINRYAATGPVRVEPKVYALLRKAQAISELTHGAFDITAAPLVKCWGFMAGSGSAPEQDALEAARQVSGYRGLELDNATRTVRFSKPGMMLDLGSIGKGYALDEAALLLREAGIENALLHGGTSTTIAMGRGPDNQPWRVAIERPPQGESGAEPLAVVALRDESLSVSAVSGKGFFAEGKWLGHVIDPRAGAPVSKAVLAIAVCESAADSDALSTALLVEGRSLELPQLRRSLVARFAEGVLQVARMGM